MVKTMYRQFNENGLANPMTKRITWTEVPRYTHQPIPVSVDDATLRGSLDCCQTFIIDDFFEKVMVKANFAGLPNFAFAQIKAT